MFPFDVLNHLLTWSLTNNVRIPNIDQDSKIINDFYSNITTTITNDIRYLSNLTHFNRYIRNPS